MALVDQPPQPGAHRPLPGIFQYLPPPVGITQVPPVVDQPLPAAVPTAASAGDGERPTSVDRRHPRRTHPRPVAAGPGASGNRGSDTTAKPVRDQGGSGGTRPLVAQPPVATPPVGGGPVARVRVQSVSARVKPPVILGRDLPEVRVETPGRRSTFPPG
jgi:hypothetical protein